MINGELSVFVEDGSAVDGPVIEWVINGIGPRVQTFGRYYAIGVLNHDELVAGIVLHGYDKESSVIEMSAYATRPWLNRRVVNYTFDLAFNVFKMRVVAARHSERNVKARKIWLRLGAVETKIPNLYGEGVAECITVYRREDWMGSVYYGQKIKRNDAKIRCPYSHDWDARHDGERVIHARDSIRKHGQPDRRLSV